MSIAIQHFNRFLSLALAVTLLAAQPRLAFSDIAVIVHPENPMTQLSKEEVKNIFLGRMTRFPGTDIAVAALEIKGNNEQKEKFYQAIANKTVNKINRYWARYLFTGKMSPPKKLIDTEAIIDTVASNPSGISYVDSNEISPAVKVVLTLP